MLQGLLDEPDVIEQLDISGKNPIFGEVLERQVNIYEAMGVTSPRPPRQAYRNLRFNAKE